MLAVAGMLPLALLAIGNLAFDFQEQTDLAHQRALETTRALGSAVDAELERSISALRVLASAQSLDDGDIEAFTKVARRAAAAQPGWRFVTLTDASGAHLVNTFFKEGDSLPTQQRENESFMRVLQTAKPQVGSLVNGRMGWAYPVRWPVLRDGKVRYVLTAVADPRAIHDIVARQRVADEGIISVFDSSRVRVARSRANDKMIGTRSHPSLERLIAGTLAEGTGVTTTLEGDEVFTAFTRLHDSNWTIVMGLPVAVAQAPARTSLAITSLVVLVSLAIGLAAAFFVARRINQPMAQLRGAAGALGRGEPPQLASSGVREIDDVAAALAGASRELKAAEAERAELLRREQEARAQAEAANSAKDQFLAMLGHELRNPLAALASAAALLEMNRSDAAAQARIHGVITRQVANLKRLTDDLLDAARALLGKIELQRTPVDLARVAAGVLGAMAAPGRTQSHRIEEDLREAWTLGDEVRLEQVVSNLVVNATKYTPAGKTIRISTRTEGANAVFEVEDEGQGLSPELAARAFDLFVQGKRHLDRSQGGLGIGLTLVRRLVELHLGEVSVHSEGEDRGSRFTVRLPAIERPADAAPLESQHASATRILIIEDNEDARETLAVLLRMMGHEVATEGDGAAGIERARRERFDVLLVDLGLPVMDGFEIARRVRAELKPVPFLVALTGYGSAEDRNRSLAAGFDEHFAKPLDLERFNKLLALRATAAA